MMVVVIQEMSAPIWALCFACDGVDAWDSDLAANAGTRCATPGIQEER